MKLPPLVSRLQQSFFGLVDRWIPKSITPNQVSIIGLVCNVILLVLYATRAIDLGLFLLLFLLTQVFDIVDGALARARKLTSDMGRILDSAIDMGSGILMLIVVASLTTLLNWWWVAILVLLYAIRFWFVLKDKDSELGGYKNALVIGFLLAYWRDLDYTLIVQLVAVFNVIVLGINVQKLQR